MAEQGCTVNATSRRLETTEDSKYPVKKRIIDVTSDDEVALTVQSILEEQGKIDVVVNNVGVMPLYRLSHPSLAEPLLDMSSD